MTQGIRVVGVDNVLKNLNKNSVPYDTRSPFVTSGIRIGTPAATSRGLKGPEMVKVAAWIKRAIDNLENEEELISIRGEVKELCLEFPLYAQRLK